MPTEEAIAVMEKLAAEADDKGLLKILKNYRKHPKPYIAKKIAAMLHRNAHAKVVDLLDEKLRKTVSGYKKRSFGERDGCKMSATDAQGGRKKTAIAKGRKRFCYFKRRTIRDCKRQYRLSDSSDDLGEGILNRKVKIESYSLEKNKE